MFKEILKRSIWLCTSHFEDLLKASGAWTCILFAFGFLVQMTGFGDVNNPMAPQSSPAAFIAILVAGLVLQLAAGSSIAVAWHRFALLGERPSLVHLRFKGQELAYAGRLLLLTISYLLFCTVLGFIIGAVFGFVYVIASKASGGPLLSEEVKFLALMLCIGIPTILTFPIFYRYSLSLPASAIGERLPFGEARRIGAGMGWPMVGATVVLLIPIVLLNFVLQYAAGLLVGGGLPTFVFTVNSVIIQVLSQMVATILFLSVISVTYRLIEERHAQTPDTSE